MRLRPFEGARKRQMVHFSGGGVAWWLGGGVVWCAGEYRIKHGTDSLGKKALGKQWLFTMGLHITVFGAHV